MKLSRYLKFTGDRKSLIPLGFKFFKYYANNYIGYNRSAPDNQYEDECMIWIASPSDSSFCNFNSEHSVLIYEYIKAGNEEHKHEFKPNKIFPVGSHYHTFTIDLETLEALKHDSVEHDPIIRSAVFKRDGKEFTKADLKAIYERYKIINFCDDTYKRLKELIDADLFTVTKIIEE